MDPVIAQLTITLFAELFFSAIFHSVGNGRVDLHAARDREQLYMKPVGEIAVDALLSVASDMSGLGSAWFVRFLNREITCCRRFGWRVYWMRSSRIVRGD